jgi:hypothetical protein
MPRVTCTVDETEIENENGRLQPGVEVKCTACNNTGQAFGTHDGSVTRALMNMKENCPRKGVRNFYITAHATKNVAPRGGK